MKREVADRICSYSSLFLILAISYLSGLAAYRLALRTGL
jgi:hypothetical protein